MELKADWLRAYRAADGIYEPTIRPFRGTCDCCVKVCLWK